MFKKKYLQNFATTAAAGVLAAGHTFKISLTASLTTNRFYEVFGIQK